MTTERYVIKTAAEMQEGEPYMNGFPDGNLDAMTLAINWIREGRAKGNPAFTHPHGTSSIVFVVDAHDPWHTSGRPTAPASSERYVVREAREMREGAPYLDAFDDLAGATSNLFANHPPFAETLSRLNAGEKPRRDYGFRWSKGNDWKLFIVDTRPAATPPTPSRPPEHRWASDPASDGIYARCLCGNNAVHDILGKWRPQDRDCAAALGRYVVEREGCDVKPTAPSRAPEPTEAERDAAVCAAWEAEHQERELLGRLPAGPRDILMVDGLGACLADYRASRSRLLRAKVAASKERDRLSVLVDIQHEDEV